MKRIRLLASLSIFVLLVYLKSVPVYAQGYSVLYAFGTRAGDPLNPSHEGIVAQGRDGNMYTTAPAGGMDGQGAVFKITPSGALTVLYNFTGSADAGQPASGLTLGTDGNLYGTASGPGPSSGVVFQLTPGGTFTVLHTFTGADGSQPQAPPIQGTDGNFYGTTFSGGGGGSGTVYRVTSSGSFKVLHSFYPKMGATPYAPLVQGSDGALYGTTTGVTGGNGTVFRVTTGGTLTILHRFQGSDGSTPEGPLVQGNDGTFYGTTLYGGANGGGTVFKITSSGQFTLLYSLNGGSDGSVPAAGLVQATDGNFYGVAGSLHNCTQQCGTLFRITPSGDFSVLYDFAQATGINPWVTLLQHTNGILYSDTDEGGSGAQGVFYSFDAGLTPFVTFLPAQGSGKINATVGIFGQGFSGATGVAFGSVPATFTVSSDTFLTAKVPIGALTGSITVKVSSGTLTSNKNFRVTPVIKNFTPTSGPPGTTVTITGASLTQTAQVSFGGVLATNFTVNSDTQVTAVVPPGAVTGKIKITTPGGTATSVSSFTVL